MNVIICIDDNQGMLFNKRRQSKDSKVLEDIASLTKELWISPFSEKLFEDTSSFGIDAKINPLFLQKAGTGEFCFVENEKLQPHANNIELLVVYKWNRNYPSDCKLDLDLNEWKLIETFDFVGNSHEKITREIYVL